jgi:hypothetical protein
VPSVAAAHLTFTHKQYTKYRERRINTEKGEKIQRKEKWEVWTVARLCEISNDS